MEMEQHNFTNLDAQNTIIVLTSSRDFLDKYGPNCDPGELTYFRDQSSQLSCPVILLVVQKDTQEFRQKHKNVLIPFPYVTNTEISSGKYCMVFPYYKQSLSFYLLKRKEEVYPIVEVSGNRFLQQIFSFSEGLKSSLLEIFKGIKTIHDEGYIHGAINGWTMIFFEVGKSGISLGGVLGRCTSGNQRDDWKAVAEFLNGLLSQRTYKPKFDSEIEDLINLLNRDSVTGDLVVEHIALWLAPRKRELINIIQDKLMANTFQSSSLDAIIRANPKWKISVFDDATNNIFTRKVLTNDACGMVTLVRNMIEHGHAEFLPVQTDLTNVFDLNEKGIIGMIDKILPRLFLDILNEAKQAGLSIPK